MATRTAPPAQWAAIASSPPAYRSSSSSLPFRPRHATAPKTTFYGQVCRRQRSAYSKYIQDELPLYRASRINLVFQEDIFPETDFLALNSGEGYGRLRALDPDDRPHPRDIVLYEALPNELPRVAGIISTVPQTPLSHVNLRAVQDGIPNAFIRDVLDDPDIESLLGRHVRYEVTEDGWDLRAATRMEVDEHYASSRPARPQTPQRDLSVTSITPLSQIQFGDWSKFGVKAANLAVLGTLGFPEGTVPDGFAIPFYFYDEFMKPHGFYDDVKEMLADADFQTDFEVQDDRLDDLRDDIKDAETPQWIIDALTAMHATYPEGQSLRYRSSTNNEDLPGFNGAGLYDSKTQHPDETEEDGIDKSMKQVFASLWTFRAFTEREFHRIDHLAAAMGVLVHPNYSDELANGVAVSFDPVFGQEGSYYVNTQVGEDLVTNPDALSVPEEILLFRDGRYDVLVTSNQVPPGQLLMSNDQLRQLREHLEVIHDHFKGLYNPVPGEPFAMEIEFKITSANILAIKQARPWVFDTTTETVTPPPPPPPDRPPPQPPGGGGGGGGGGAPRTSAPGSPRSLAAVGGNGEVVLTWGRSGERRRRGDHRLRVPDQQEWPLDFHRFHRDHLYGHRPRQRHGLRLRGAGGQRGGQECLLQPGRGDAGSVHTGLCAFRQWGWHHLRSGVRECGDPSDPARPLFLR